MRLIGSSVHHGASANPNQSEHGQEVAMPRAPSSFLLLVAMHLLLLANLVTTSKAPVTTSVNTDRRSPFSLSTRQTHVSPSCPLSTHISFDTYVPQHLVTKSVNLCESHFQRSGLNGHLSSLEHLRSIYLNGTLNRL